MIDLPYFRDLQTASYKGIPFGVMQSSYKIGRKNAIHNYPFVDGVYVEDLGVQGIVYRFNGFFVEGGGAYKGSGTLVAQLAKMNQAIKNPGDGELTHPQCGKLQNMNVLEFEVTFNERGRMASFELSLIVNRVTISTTILINTQQNVVDAGSASLLQQATDYADAAQGVVRSATQAVLDAVNKATTLVRHLLFDATSMIAMVANLPGAIGRMIGQTVPTGAKQASSTVQSLVGQASYLQQQVLSASVAFVASVATLNTSTIAAAAQSLIAALQGATPSPAHTIKTMQAFIGGTPSLSYSTLSQTLASNSITDLLRRAAVVAMAQASASYQPTSYNDAQAVKSQIVAAIGAEMLIAANQGQDGTYMSLLALQSAVTIDLTRRGATLAKIVTVSSPLPVSSLVWAQKLYQDVTREPQIVNEGNPIHPAFMPIKFQVLSS